MAARTNTPGPSEIDAVAASATVDTAELSVVPSWDQCNETVPAMSTSTRNDRWFPVVNHFETRVWSADGVQSFAAHQHRTGRSAGGESAAEWGVVTYEVVPSRVIPPGTFSRTSRSTST